MRQTLFYIPHEVAGIPTFGVGWLFVVWLFFSVGFLVWLARRQGWTRETRSHIPTLIVVGIVIAILLPFLEERVGDQILGVPIRGYGVMMLFGVVSGVGLAMYRARRMGIHPDRILSLAMWMFIAGILGARIFYVIEFWEQFKSDSIIGTVKAVLKVTEGGLVVYGSLIGALAAAFANLRRYKMPILAIGDLVAPSLLLGLAFGRIGCLLNGCCFGDVCERPWAITFPRSSSSHDPSRVSPPYVHQHQTGRLHGFQIGADANGKPVVSRVEANSKAEQAGLEVGQSIKSINNQPVETIDAARMVLAAAGPSLSIQKEEGYVRWSVQALPERTFPVHPTQIYSAINAVFICLFLLAVYPFRRRDGEVIALCLTIYPFARFLLEMIRADAPAFTGLTISQIVSILLGIGIVALWVYILRQPQGSVLPRAS